MLTVAAYIEQFIDRIDKNGQGLVVRNGYHGTTVSVD